MHYFKFNIGDYHKKAGRLTMIEHGAYTLLLHACYDRECFPTKEEAIDWCWARTADEVAAVEFVLGKFFRLEDGRYVQDRIMEEIDAYHEKAEKNRHIALEREEKRRTKRARNVHDTSPETHEAPPNQEPVNQEPVNQEPITTEPEEKSSQAKPARRSVQLPSDFYPNETGVKYAENRRVSLAVELESFRNWHTAKGTTMKDWQAGWRTWCDKAVEFGRAGRYPYKKSPMNNIGVDDQIPEGFSDGLS